MSAPRTPHNTPTSTSALPSHGQATAFLLSEHYPQIATWAEAHALPTPSPADLPAIGIIVPGVACGFLLTGECGTAFLEGYLTNPQATPKARNKALDVITRDLIAMALHLQCRSLMALTVRPEISLRAQRHGFLPTPHSALRRPLR